MKIEGLTPSESSGAGRSSRWPIVAALVALTSVALCIKAIIPLQPGLVLFASTAVFVVPGFLLAWLIYEPAAGRGFAACVIGPIWGYGLSSLVLLALWIAGVRGSVLLAVPLLGCVVAALAGGLLRGSLTPPRFGRPDLTVVLFLLVSVPAIVGLPFAHVAEPVPQGRAYRAYFTADMIWRMAVVAEVSKGDVPPRNPFLRGEPLHYYWLPHLLTAAQYRHVPRQISMEQVLLVNSVALGLAFVLFLFGFVRQWVESPVARGRRGAWRAGVHEFRGRRAADGVLAREVFDCSAVTDLNIDAVTRWFYQSLPIDGLQRLLWYQPHHSTGYALGLSALMVLFQCRGSLTPRLLAFCGCLLGATLLFSTFASIMLTMMVAVTAAILLAGQRRWVAFAIGAVAGAIPLALAVMVARSLRYVDLSGPSLVRVLVNPMAVQNMWISFLLSFGPMLILGAAGAWLAVRRGQASRFLGIAAIVLVSFTFYFFVDVRDHQYVYVGWRAGHFLFVALAALVGYGLQELWRTGGRTRATTIAVDRCSRVAGASHLCHRPLQHAGHHELQPQRQQ